METGGGNTRRTRQNSNITPPSRRLDRAVTVPPGRGGGHSGDPTGPTQIHTQDGVSRVEQTDRGPGGTGSSGGHGGAGSSGGHGGAGSSGGHGGTASETAAPAPTSVSSAGALLPPPKISLGKLRGIRSPPGLNTQKQLKRPWSLSGQIRPRPAGLSIRQRPSGDTIIGWLDK